MICICTWKAEFHEDIKQNSNPHIAKALKCESTQEIFSWQDFADDWITISLLNDSWDDGCQTF